LPQSIIRLDFWVVAYWRPPKAWIFPAVALAAHGQEGMREVILSHRRRLLVNAALALSGVLAGTGIAASADLGPQPRETLIEPAPPPSQWQFTFTPYLWLPWMSGNMVVKGRGLDVALDPAQIISHLDWPVIVPAWMSHVEARRGPLSLFNDIVWTDLSGSGGFSRTRSGRIATATFGAHVQADYQLAIVETGGAYTIWSQGRQGSPGSTAFDLLAGARVWYQNVDVSADLKGTLAFSGPRGITISGSRAVARSGSVDWVDPFIGARIRQQLAPGQAIELRGDVGGFGAGSQFSWQAIATYNSPLCAIHGIPVDGYVGFRALSVDYSQGSGTSKFEFDNVIYGPVIGATMRF
jgi:hypothetical protein